MDVYHDAKRQIRMVRSIVSAPVLTCQREVPGMEFSDSLLRISCDSPMVAVRRNFLRQSIVYECKACKRPIEITLRQAQQLRPQWSYKEGWWHREFYDENSS